MRSLSRLTCLLLLITLTTGCSWTPQLNVGPRAETRTIHERLGQPSVVAQDTPIKVTTVDENGKPVSSTIRADGMIVLDRPTYELYQRAWEAQKKATREKVDVDVTPSGKQ